MKTANELNNMLLIVNLASGHCPLPGEALAMVSTCLRTTARRNVATLVETPQKHAAVRVSGCRECLSLALVPKGSRDNSCLWCDQVDDLLCLVAELKEEVERLRSIRECEREIDCWSRTLSSPGSSQQMEAPQEAPQEAENPLPSCHQAEGGNLRDDGEWKHVPAQGGRQIPSWPPLSSQLHLHNRYRALKLEGQAKEDVGEGISRGLPRESRSAPHIMTTSVKKKRRVIVVGNSLL